MDKSQDEISNEDLFDMKVRIDDELRQLRVAELASGRGSFSDSEQELVARVDELKSQLLDESNKRSRDSLLVRRSQLGQTLLKALFLNEERAGDTGSDADFVALSLKELELVLQVKRILRETSDLEDELEKKKTENMRLKSENCKMMTSLKDDKKTKTKMCHDLAKNADYRKVRDEHEIKVGALKINKSVTQLVLQNCGIDLVQDERYQELLCKCGEQIDL